MVALLSNQKIVGTGRKDILSDGEGDDLLLGRGGSDVLLAGFGDDTLNGGNGADFLSGGFGNNTLIGGRGDDTFLIDAGLGGGISPTSLPANAFDTVTDFEGGAPIRVTANVILPAPRFTDTLLIDNAAGAEVELVQNGADVDLYIDRNLRATLLNADAETVFAATEFTDGEAPASFSFSSGDGDNHAPIITLEDPVAQTFEGGFFEDDANFLVFDPDFDTLTFSLTGKAPPGVSLSPEGIFVVDGTDPFYDYLDDEEEFTALVEYEASDGNGGVVTDFIEVIVVGVTDAILD